MNDKEFYKDYINSLKDCASGFNFEAKSIKLKKFLNINKESEDRYLQCKAHLSMSHNFMTECLAWVCFKEIEFPLTKILIKYHVLGSSAIAKGVWHPTLSIYGHQSFHPFEKKPHYFKVKNISTRKQALVENQMIVDYWNSLVIPFFNYFTDIHNLIPYIQDDSQIKEKINPIGGYQRKLLIWYFCSHPEYENYKEHVINMVSNYLNSQESEKWKSITMDVIEFAEKKDPLYSWDEKYLVEKPIPAIVKEFDLDNYPFEAENEETSKWKIFKFWNNKKA